MIGRNIQGLYFGTDQPPLQQQVTTSEYSEAQHTSLHLVQMLLPALRHSLATEDPHTSSACCSMLIALMARFGDFTLACEVADAIVKLGE